ncbi:MAG: carbohydrate kinase [Pseudomonadota bacterium]
MILCCGEALIDMIPPPGGAGFVPHPGGAVFNTAVALGRLDASVGLLTGLSTDMFGDQLRAALSASHVEAGLAVVSDRPSTLAFVKLTDGAASYSFFDENSAGRMMTAGDMPALPDAVRTLFFGGISLACEPCADGYAHLLATQGTGRVVMIDPNIRAGFIADEARYRARLNTMLAAADIVKVSDEDLAWIIGTDQSLESKAVALLALGLDLVIVTRGADGATGFTKTHPPVHVQANTTKVVDTVGAGDTFNAGLLASLQAGGHLTKAGLAAIGPADLEMALTLAAKVAAVTVSRAGANPPFRSELN